MQIPDYVVKNNKLSDSAKVLYGLILDNTDNEICIKDNTFFSACFGGVTDRTIRNYLNELKNEGLIAQINYQRIKNAIFILNKQDIKEVQKISSIADFDFNSSNLENIFQDFENPEENSSVLNPILNILKDLYNLVLVSKENKIKLNKSAGARVRAHETTFSKTNNVNKFSSYENAGSSERVRTFDYKARHVYTDLLFKDFFKNYKASFINSTALEIVDNMIEAFNQSQTEQGFVFDGVSYNSDKLLDVYLNITQEEFTSIVNSVISKEDIKTRSPYILGAVVKAGRKLSPKKTFELVRRGCPWDYHVPSGKEYKDLFFMVQQSVERERRDEQLLQELRQCTNTC